MRDERLPELGALMTELGSSVPERFDSQISRAQGSTIGRARHAMTRGGDMSPFEDTTEQARYDALVAGGASPEDAHNQVVAEREALVGSGEPQTPAEGEGPSEAEDTQTEPEAQTTEPQTDFDPEADTGPATEAEREPDAFDDVDPQSKVAGSHDYTGEKGNPSQGERPGEVVGSDEAPLVSDREAGEAEVLPQATVPPSARSLPGDRSY